MAELKVTFEGLEAAEDQLKRDFKEFLKLKAEQLNDSLVAKTPIRSGNARSKWKSTVSKDGFESVNRVPYIERLENNWSKQTRGRGIVKPALNDFNRKKP